MTLPETDKVPLSAWMDALVETMAGVAINPLGYKGSELVDYPASLPDGLNGAAIPFDRGEHKLRFCLMGDERANQALAHALFCMGPSDPKLSKEDVADALGEILNIVAGLIKNRIAARDLAEDHSDIKLQIGLPAVIANSQEINELGDKKIAKIRIGPVFSKLIIVRDC